MMTREAIDRFFASVRWPWARVMRSWGWLGREEPAAGRSAIVGGDALLERAVPELLAVHRAEQAALLAEAALIAQAERQRGRCGTRTRVEGLYVPPARSAPLASWRRRCDEERAAAGADGVALSGALARCRAARPVSWAEPVRLAEAAVRLAPSEERRLLVAELALAAGETGCALRALRVLWKRGVSPAIASRYYDALATARELTGEPVRALRVLGRIGRHERPHARRLVQELGLALCVGDTDAAQRAAARIERLDLGCAATARELESALLTQRARRARTRAQGARGRDRLPAATRAQALEWTCCGGAALARTCLAVL